MILGVDLLHLVLDFTETLVQVCYANVVVATPSPSMVLLGDVQTTASMVEDPEYLVPSFQKSTSSQLLECPKTDILALVEEHQDLFQTNPCLTDLACHFIPTTGNPVRLQLQCVPAQYREDINRQLEKIVQLGIITESNSPWMAPAVFCSKEKQENSIYVWTTEN